MSNRRQGANSRKKAAGTSRRRRTAVQGAQRMGARLSVVVLLLGLLVAGVVMGRPHMVQWMRGLSILKVRAVNIAGAGYSDKNEVLKSSGIMAGMFVGDVDVKKVAASVKKIPWVRDVMVKRSLFGGVTLKVSERVPVAQINVGTVHLVDRDGILLDGEPSGNLPLVSGFTDTLMQGVRRIRISDMQILNNFMDQARTADRSLCERITQVDFSKGGMIRMNLQGNPAVITMEAAEDGGRFGQLSQLIGSMDDTVATVKVIDLRYANLAFVQYADAVVTNRQGN